MKYLMLLMFLLIGCTKSPDIKPGSANNITTPPGVTPNNTSGGCGTHNGKTLYLGPQGGCYYINSNGNKTYVARSECKC